MEIPADYHHGYALARKSNPELAERYVANTTVGDPKVDAVLKLLDQEYPKRKQGWIQRGIEGGVAAIPEAPEELKSLFETLGQPPEWWDEEATLPGCRLFHRHSQMLVGAFVGSVLVEGFSTMISKSFSITGRIVDQGVRRLKQNNRHLIEIFMPGGMNRQADGWKLSVRIRLVHAQVRALLSKSEDWDAERWGTPLSAAHISFATAAFSALLLKRAKQLGVKAGGIEREAFMQIWRYSGHLMGVPPQMLFSDEAEALELVRIGYQCEPAPGLEARQLAHGLIQAAPVVAGINEDRARKKLVRKIYRISRALIGNELADQLEYPPAHTLGTLAPLRLMNLVDQFLQKQFPIQAAKRQSKQFTQMLDLSHYDPKGMAHRVPETVYAETDKPL